MQSKRIKKVKAKKIGISTHSECVVYVREDSQICKSEGCASLVRIKVSQNGKFIIATLNIVTSDLIDKDEVGLCNCAFPHLGISDGDYVTLSHPDSLSSLSHVRAKVYGNELSDQMINDIIKDIGQGLYSDLYIASFLTACANNNLNRSEITSLTKAMIAMGEKLTWDADIVVDKHCVGGVPGNRTTLIVVPIVAAFGLHIPKTSSRAITSPAGTADTMEVLAPVNLSLNEMKKVVDKEHGCIVWGGSVTLSPVDDILIRVEKALQIDSEGQVIASVLSKKFSAGSTHVLLDIPIGATAKVRSKDTARRLKANMDYVAKKLGLNIKVLFTDGRQPVGQSMGPALEAEDVLAVLQNTNGHSQHLREKSLELAGKILEFSPKVKHGEGYKIAAEILDSGKAWTKFQAICEAQGGMREIPKAKYNYPVESLVSGKIVQVDNRKLARIAKLAGAPHSATAGLKLHVMLDDIVKKGEPLFTIYAHSKGELAYSQELLHDLKNIIKIKE